MTRFTDLGWRLAVAITVGVWLGLTLDHITVRLLGV